MPKSTRQSDTAFAIVLFTDMVGSTAIASELGDHQWRVLQAKHHSVIRAQLREHGGREIDTAGDGFFATFTEGEAAVRCACAIRDATMEIGLQVRCGLNVGQVEMNDGKPTGAAVVAAARIMSKAGDGEVLVSNLLRELIPGSKIEFTDAGMHELKGLDGSWHLFRVVAVDGPPLTTAPQAEELASRRTSTVDTMVANGSSVSRTTKILAGTAAFLILAAGIAFLTTRNDVGSTDIAPNSIGILDPASGELRRTIDLGKRPGDIAASADAVWVTNPDDAAVMQVDPNTGDIRNSVALLEHPAGIAIGLGRVWVVESGGRSVSSIDEGTGEFVQRIPVGNGPEDIAIGDGSVWVTNRFDGTVSRIDLDGGAVVQNIWVGLDPQGIVFGFGSIWVGLAGSKTVVRLDPQTNTVTTSIGVGNGPVDLTVGHGSVWVVNQLDGTVSQIDPETKTVEDTIKVLRGASGITTAGGSLWVSNEADATLTRLEFGTAVGSVVRVGSTPQASAPVGDSLWVSVRGTSTTHVGGTLQLVSDRMPGSLDSGNSYDDLAYAMMHLVGDGLVAVSPIGGLDATVIPDLAVAVPTPEEGGRAYTFTLRSDVRYSDGSTVAPADFRRAIERVYRLRSTARFLFDGIVGTDGCKKASRACDLSDGIHTDDVARTVTFRLHEPDPDFLFKLTLPPAYPVPDGVNARDDQAGVPGTGPYMLEAPMTDTGVALIRNPLFDVWSPTAQPDGYVDRIEWRFGLDADAQVEAVERGDADLTLDANTTSRLDELRLEFTSRTYARPTQGTFWVTLDMSKPPFDDVKVRRALNLAIDRNRVVDLYGGVGAAAPTCQQLPPNFPGYEPFCPYTSGAAAGEPWKAPDPTDLEAILPLQEGRRHLVFEYALDLFTYGRSVGRYFKELLGGVGYKVRLREVSSDVQYAPGHNVQALMLDGWYPDFAAASNFFVGILTCDSFIPYSTFCDPRIDAMIERARTVDPDDPASRAQWSKVDRAVVREAPFVWLTTPLTFEFVSERVGNYQWNLQWGTLFNQLWVR